MPQRDDELRRHRNKWRAKRERRPGPSDTPPVAALAEMQALIQRLKTPAPARFPGAADPALERPDQVKLALATFAFHTPPGKTLAMRLQQQLAEGLLADLPQLDHWGMELFFWRGVPGEHWHPVEAFLDRAGSGFSPAAQAQLRLWKQARLGLFEIGAVRDYTVELHEWDPVADALIGAAPLRAIALCLGGVNDYRPNAGRIHLTYLAPWAPADNLYCAMGYGTSPSKRDAGILAAYLGLNHPEIVARPLPWRTSPAAADAYLRQWRSRDWHRWLAARLEFPFAALTRTSPARIELRNVEALVPATPETAREIGIYFHVPLDAPRGDLAVGATMLEPIDVTSSATMALAEYRAYRKHVGPPPGVVGRPDFMRIK